MPPDARRPLDPTRRIRRQLLLTRAGVVAERLTRAFWPFWTVALIVAAVLLSGISTDLPLEAVWFGTLAIAGALIGTLIRGILRFRWPTARDASERLDSTLPGRPIAALSDAQAIGTGDAGSEQVWKAHMRRMLLSLSAARPVQPDLRLARFDRYGLRFIALTVFVTMLVFGSWMRLGQTLPANGSGPIAVAAGPSWEGWAEPPAWTGRPSLISTTSRQARWTCRRAAGSNCGSTAIPVR